MTLLFSRMLKRILDRVTINLRCKTGRHSEEAKVVFASYINGHIYEKRICLDCNKTLSIELLEPKKYSDTIIEKMR